MLDRLVAWLGLAECCSFTYDEPSGETHHSNLDAAFWPTVSRKQHQLTLWIKAPAIFHYAEQVLTR